MADKSEQPTDRNSHFCAHCGTENVKAGYACTRCGERLVEIDADTPAPLGLSSCARCGSANNTRAAYCWVCGSETKDAVRITPKPTPELTIPTAAGPRTYRPDLNPVAPPTNKPSANRPAEAPDLREPATDSGSDMKIETPISQQNPFGSPDTSVENTSGTKDGEIPPGVKRWNWAAFLMPAVWGLFSGVPYTAILFGAALLPPTVQLIVMVVASLYLGAKGNELAWRGKKWRSVEHFRAFQKQWTSWAIKLTFAVGALLLLWVISTAGA
jgi:hypothetical protein